MFELPNHGTAFNGSSPCPPKKGLAECPYRELIFLEKLEIPRDSNVGSVDSWVSRLLVDSCAKMAVKMYIIEI